MGWVFDLGMLMKYTKYRTTSSSSHRERSSHRGTRQIRAHDGHSGTMFKRTSSRLLDGLTLYPVSVLLSSFRSSLSGNVISISRSSEYRINNSDFDTTPI